VSRETRTVPIDREATLRQAERLKGQGRLDLAIAEYVRLVEDQPRDWNTINALGDLYLRAGDIDRAVLQFVLIADHLFGEGFFPKAAAVYKKALKSRPDHEHTLLRLAEIAAAQELLADARAYLRKLWELRSGRGDDRGAAECLIRLAELPEADAETMLTGARAARVLGETARAAALFRASADELQRAGRSAAALDALAQVVDLEPGDVGLRRQLAGQYVAAGEMENAGRLLDAETAGQDPDLLLMLASIESARKDDAAVRSTLTRFIGVAPDRSADVLRLAGELGRGGEPDRAFACSDVVVDDALLRGDWDRAIDVLQSFLVHGEYVPALVKLVQIAGDTRHDDLVMETRERLVDAYLEGGRGAEAQAVAEALLAGAPESAVHAGRLRRAFELEGIDDPDEAVRRVRERFAGSRNASTAFLEVSPDASTAFPDVSRNASTAFLDVSRNASTAFLDASQDASTAFLEPVVPVVQPADDIGPVSSFEVIAELPDAPTELDAPDGSFEIFSDDSPGLDDVEVVLELNAAPSTNSREESSADVDLSAAISALGAPLRPAPAADAAAIPSVAEAAGLFERGQQRLDRGQAREGLADLEKAARVAEFRFQAASRLGREYAARGHASVAIEWLERAAAMPAPSSDASLAVLYELGVALEGVGEIARALAVFMEIDSEEPGYRDVGARLAVLVRVENESRG
jgi:tetratricopeptide (TPR) repeat protein